MNGTLFLSTTGASAIAPSWQWDESIRDFRSLKHSVERLAQRSAKARVTSAMTGVLTLLGDIERVRKEASLAFLEDQAPSGWMRNIDALVVRGEGYRPFQEIFIRHRERAGH
jgi:hypothetical protein